MTDLLALILQPVPLGPGVEAAPEKCLEERWLRCAELVRQLHATKG
jgi:hypothetical protein